ncbi:MAG: hypothetical protein ACQEQS_10740 [Thermodesulfobacteriota bacterium]
MKNSTLLMSVLLALSIAASGFASDDFQSWVKQQQKDYTSFLEERDKEFHSFLKQKWKDFDVDKGQEEDTAPKPVQAPVADKKEPEKQNPVQSDIVTKVEKEKPEKDYIPDVKKKEPKKKFKLNFYGSVYELPYIEELNSLGRVNADKDSIADFFADFASVDTKPLINSFKYHKSEKNLNDWAYFLLVKEYADKTLKDENAASLLTWALMLKSGYDVRAGYSSNKIRLLFASESRLYSIPFFTLDSKKYYLFNDDSKSVKSYDAKYEGADKKLKAFFTSRPSFFTGKAGTKKLEFEHNNKKYSITAYYDPYLISFMQTLPQFSLEKYFMGNPDDLISYYLANELKDKMKGFSNTEKVNFLLSFVQKAFPYKTDDEQFNYEKYFYPEEMIYYPYSDCEDRSAFLAALVKKTTGFDVAVLDYPGHVAVAVNIPESKAKGDYIRIEGKRYHIADPTYINAEAGMLMPEYKNKKPDIFLF